MKIKLIFVLTFTIIIAILLPHILGVQIVNASEIEYSVTGGTLLFDIETGTISGYNGTPTQVDIPSEINGVKVTTIGELAFYDCSGLTSIHISNSVTVIEEDAFWLCDDLISINVDEDNPKFSSIDGVLFSKDMTSLYKFPAKKNITEYKVPDSIECILGGAFAGSSSLMYISIPKSVTSIGELTFFNCNELTNIDAHRDNTQYTSVDGVLFSKDMSSLYKFPAKKNQTKYQIPVHVKTIDRDAFKDCSILTNIRIPSSVTKIGDYAFMGCIGLESINVIEDNSYYTSVDGILFSKDMTTLLKFPPRKSVAKYKIPDKVKKVSYYAFQGCRGLVNVVIPKNVSSIEEGSFENCSGLTSLAIPTNVDEIGWYAFSGCTGLKDINIPKGVWFIENEVFAGCTGLSNIIIPDNVGLISSSAFSGCSGLTSIIIPKSVNYINSDAFYGCTNLTIYGESKSTAETFAKSNGIKFINISEIKSATPKNFRVVIK